MLGMTFFLCIGKTFFYRLHHCAWQVFFKVIKFIIITPTNA
ncbi:Uncharacterised protein [Mycobacteroides abscessus subsp. abscessus]|nr:Uncharacterised protein [Mycobacteroides abscessus subsp. abscessus]